MVSSSFTLRRYTAADEAAAIESLGHKVHLVEASFLNLKITTPSDLAVAEALLRVRS